jgi:hypothetical protein
MPTPGSPVSAAAHGATAHDDRTSSTEPGNMVIARLMGGLGNQMFQYAAARRIALKNGWPIKLDVSGFGSYRRRAYALGHFRIVEDFASPEDIRRLKRTRLGLFLQRLAASARQTHVQERHFHFDPRVRDIRSGVYLAGYWQSDKYFADVADTIRAEFTPRAPASGRNLGTLRLIESANSVSVHVRRGDYVSNPSAKRLHGCCSPDYYRRALAEISNRVREPHFFVFSDDASWARENLAIDGPVVFVDHNGPGEAHEDLRLMSRCRHHVIANSTFGWWGAWLGAHPDQIVVAPKKWFASGSNDTRDLFPDRWLQL